MIFVVETGEGLSTATSYVSVEEADAYFTQTGETRWPLPTDADNTPRKQLALNNATRSIDLLYGDKFLGAHSEDDQALEFPRDDEVPKRLKDAVCEVAVMALNNEEILPNVSITVGVKKSKVKIDVLEFDDEYDGSTSNEQLNGFYKIELILAPLLENRGKKPGLRSVSMYL